MDTKLAQRTNKEFPLGVLLTAMFGLTVLRSAWVSEDAYITLRTVDNFVNGYGLTWNVAERVQAYTHPFWMFALSVPYYFTREAFYTTLFLSILTSIIAFIVVLKMLHRLTLATIAGLCVLIFSKSFIDFSTSGLENPLTHLLLAIFLFIFLEKSENFDNKTIFRLSFVACLAIINRMDTILFFVPALIFVSVKRRSWSGIKWMAVGFLPFFLWEIFSIFYYGFPFPNTAYAKLNTGLLRFDLIEAGYLYFINSIHWDPITLFVISTSLGLTFFQESWREKFIAIGVLLYLMYVMWIGADFMSGRFFSGALLVAVVLLNRCLQNTSFLHGLIIFVLIFGLGLISPTPTLSSIDETSFPAHRMDINGIADERSFYYQSSSLIYAKLNTVSPYHDWAILGQKLKAEGIKYDELENIGYAGYFAGPHIFIIDKLALADPLLSHLPPIYNKNWRIGHFERAIPDGYFESVKHGDNRISNPNLAAYYDKLRLAIRGPLWSPKRLLAILDLNTGRMDNLLRSYKP